VVVYKTIAILLLDSMLTSH